MQTRQIRKIVCLLLAACFLCLAFCACAKAPEDDFLRARMEELLPRSYTMNEILYGKGLAYTKTEGFTGLYQPVTEDCAYTSVQAIEEEIRQIYTTEYANALVEIFFSGVSSEDTAVSYARYIDQYGYLTVNTEYEVRDMSRRYDLSTMQIKKKTADYALIALDSVIESGDHLWITLTLRRSGDTWLLDSPTY